MPGPATHIEAGTAPNVSHFVRRAVWYALGEHWRTTSLALLLLIAANLIAQGVYQWSEDFFAF